MSAFLQIFLGIDIFFVGVLTAVAVRHAYAHYRPEKHEPEKSHPATQNAHLPPAVREHLLETAQANFQHILDRSAMDLQKDLEDTAGKITKLLDRLGAEVVGNELEHYRTDLERLRKQTSEDISQAKSQLSGQQAELKAKLTEEITAEKQRAFQEIQAEKQRLVQQLDTKLADAVASFLVETLQHNVDLGAQTKYLTAMLEEHKTELAKEVTGED